MAQAPHQGIRWAHNPSAFAIIAIAVTACTDGTAPLSLSSESETTSQDATVPAPQTFGSNIVFGDGTHAFSDEDFELLSSPAEVAAGLYRFRPTTGETPDIVRDDFIVAPDEEGTTVVRRVLSTDPVGGDLILDTGPAYWHEVIRGGTYALTLPLGGGGEGRLVDPQKVSVPIRADSMTLPAVGARIVDEDVCAWLHAALDVIPGAATRRVCGEEVSMEIAYGVSLGIAGTLDSLRILDGDVRVTGDLDIAMTIDAGSIAGGRAPVFAPCDRAAYRGCLATPTGANLIDFLRRYAPAIPDGALPSTRVCIPGTPVRIARGFWSGFSWNPPRFEQCRISDVGALPQVVLPSVESAANEIRPRITGFMVIRAIGDGQFTLEIPIPGAGAKAGYQITNDFVAKAAVGAFVVIRLTVKNGGGTVLVAFDDTGRMTQSWDGQAGWAHDYEIVDKNHHGQILEVVRPDSIVLRGGVTAKVAAEVCIGLIGCDVDDDQDTSGGSSTDFQLTILGRDLIGGTGLNVGAKLGVGVTSYSEATYTREQVHPDDPEVDNIHYSMDGAYGLFGSAGLHIPLTGWILPNVPRSGEADFECCRVPVGDQWGQGQLRVSTSTTGSDLDPDGYTVLVEPVDSTPDLLRAGAQLLGNPWAPTTFAETVAPEGEVMFGPSRPGTPCLVVYSDALLYANPVYGLPVAGARATGVSVPTYAVASACPWLIAPYRVTLSDVAANCTVAGGAVRDSVWLQQFRLSPPLRDDVREVDFEVDCTTAQAQGDLRVVLDPDGRERGRPPTLSLEGSTAGVFDLDTLTVAGLAPATYTVEIGGLREGCSASPTPAAVLAGQTVEVQPVLTCAPYTPPPGTVTYVASTSGESSDPNGFTIVVDGEPAAPLPNDDSSEVRDIAPSVPTVFMVAGIAGNCQPQGLNPQMITLDGAGTPVEVPFPVVCTSAVADTLEGTVDANGWPSPTVTLRAQDGTTLVVNGPLNSELARLTGSPLRVWGIASATGLDAYGYDLRSELGDDRWMGILMDRPDGVWLFGREAIELVDPPPGIEAQSGNLVWVMGSEVPGGVRPTLYGVIRGG